MGKAKTIRASKRQKLVGEAAQELFVQQNAEAALAAASDAELFQVDRQGSRRGARIAAQLREAKRRDADAAGYSLTEEKKVARMLRDGKVAVVPDAPQEERKELYDPWSVAAPTKGRSLEVSLAETTRRRRRRAKAKAPSVVLALPGQSVNPSFSAHQDALGLAVASEIARLEAVEEAQRPISRGYLLPGTVDPRADRDDSDDSLSDTDSEDEAGGGGMPRTRKMRKGKLTIAERNRQRLARQRRKEAEEDRQRNKKLRSINAAGDMLKALAQEEREHRSQREELKELKDATASEVVDPTAKTDVLLTEEVSSSLRGMTTRGSQIADRAAIITAQGHATHKSTRKNKRVRKRLKKVRLIQRA